MFDDNASPPKSDHFSVKGACAASHGKVNGLTNWDDFRGVKTSWYPWKHGQFNVTEHQLHSVGMSFSRVVDIYAEMPPLWLANLKRPAPTEPCSSTIRPRGWMQTTNKLSPVLRCNEQAALCITAC